MSERRHVIPLPLGDEIPFSKGLMARALIVTGLDPERSHLIARRVDKDLSERNVASLDLDRLGELAADVIGVDEAARTVRRLRRLDALQRLDEPLLLLVGGTTGTGKSSIATEAAHRLGITRVTSTDFIRQTMRAFFAEEFMPSVHYSSFEARLALTRAEEEESGDAAILGFLDQTRNVLVGVQAALERAATERWSMVLEGVHLVPGMVAAEVPRGVRGAMRGGDRGREPPPKSLLGSRLRDRGAYDRSRSTSMRSPRSERFRTISSSGHVDTTFRSSSTTRSIMLSRRSWTSCCVGPISLSALQRPERPVRPHSRV